jgi:heme/copper-type cytochrome/quinol oxidase subunit 2
MQNALGLMMDQSVMFAIIIALGAAGIIGLFLAVYWPPRWHLQYRIEVFFAALLVGLAVYADARSTTTYQAYEAVLPKKEMISGNWDADIKEGDFDRVIKVYAYQWGFTFFDDKGAASRNAVKVEPGEKVMFALMANDVIHGFNIPAACRGRLRQNAQDETKAGPFRQNRDGGGRPWRWGQRTGNPQNQLRAKS